MTEQHHRIRRQVLELHIQDQAQAWPLQAALGRIHEQQLAAMIERCCDEVGDPRRVHRIDLLEVDLGPLDPDHVERDLLARIGPAMGEALARRIRRDDEDDALAARDPESESQLELVAHVARHGHLPWWADPSRRNLVDEAVGLLLRRATPSLIALVRELARERAALVRLVAACGDDRLSALLSALLADARREVPDRAEVLQALLHAARAGFEAAPRFRLGVWIGALRTSIEEVGAGGAIGFWREAIARAAAELGVTYRALVERLARLEQVDRGRVNVAHVETAGGGQPDTLCEVVRALLRKMHGGALASGQGAGDEVPAAAAATTAALVTAAELDRRIATAAERDGGATVVAVIADEAKAVVNSELAAVASATAPAAESSAATLDATTPRAAERDDAAVANASPADAKAVTPTDAYGETVAKGDPVAVANADAAGANDDTAGAATAVLESLLAELASLERPRLRDLFRELDRASRGRPGTLNEVMQVYLHEMRGRGLANERLVREDVSPRAAVKPPAAAASAVEQDTLTTTATERHDAAVANAVAADATTVRATDANGDESAVVNGDPGAIANPDTAMAMLESLLAELASLDRSQLRDLVRELDRASRGRPGALNEATQVFLHEVRGGRLANKRLVREDEPRRTAVTTPAAAASAAAPDTLTSTAVERQDTAVANAVAADAKAVTASDANGDERHVANGDPVADANILAADAKAVTASDASRDDRAVENGDPGTVANADTADANANAATAMREAFLAALASLDWPQLRGMIRELDRARRQRDESSNAPAPSGEAAAVRARVVEPPRQANVSGEVPADANDVRRPMSTDGGSPASRDGDLDSATDARLPPSDDEGPDAVREAPGAHTPAHDTISELEIVLQRLARLQVPMHDVFVRLSPAVHTASGERQRALLRILQDIARESSTGGLSVPEMAARLVRALPWLLETSDPGAHASRLGPPAPRGQISTTHAGPALTIEPLQRTRAPQLAETPPGDSATLADPVAIPRPVSRRSAPPPVHLLHIDADEAYVQNAGLVVLWPFLRRLFERLELVADKQFVNDAARERAVGLLQHLATGDREPVEHDLPLTKVLCGLELCDLVELGPPVTDPEAEECTRLVSAAIAHAPILGDMSVSGFRTAFVLRNGVVTTRDGAWLLRVERVPGDVVLDRLPWGVSWIKLPWMEAPLGVEW
ncbi:MAG TPA: contractile injection system tape measure protein [Kofleriaceae bacterium]|nr:contractile injection system tape measure protein [Kofleriaceae bacterium]